LEEKRGMKSIYFILYVDIAYSINQLSLFAFVYVLLPPGYYRRFLELGGSFKIDLERYIGMRDFISTYPHVRYLLARCMSHIFAYSNEALH
jgi:hypothetical protein